MVVCATTLSVQNALNIIPGALFAQYVATYTIIILRTCTGAPVIEHRRAVGAVIAPVLTRTLAATGYNVHWGCDRIDVPDTINKLTIPTVNYLAVDTSVRVRAFASPVNIYTGTTCV